MTHTAPTKPREGYRDRSVMNQNRDIQEQVKTLMSDGRERTFNDIRHRVPACETKLKGVIASMVHKSILKGTDGPFNIRIWRATQ